MEWVSGIFFQKLNCWVWLGNELSLVSDIGFNLDCSGLRLDCILHINGQ